MKKLAVILATVGVVGLAAPALADPDTTGNPPNGNQGCIVDDTDIVDEIGDYFKNPGKALQAFRAVLGQNPKEVIDASDPADVNLGQAIKENCGFVDPS